jgi:hypothetical protein
LKVLVAAAAAFALSGCVTGLRLEDDYAATPDETAKIISGEMGAIVVDLGLPRLCNGHMTVRYRNLTTKTTITRTLDGVLQDGDRYIFPGAIPYVLPVQPGRYIFDGGTCVSSDSSYIYTQQLDGMALWLMPFEVEKGKLIYTGTPFSEQVSQEFGVALTDLEKFSGRTVRSSDTYGLYDIRDGSARVRQLLAKHYPVIADRLVSQPTATLLDKEMVRAIIAVAYEREAKGIAPDDATAARNRKAAKALVQQGLRKYLIERLTEELVDPPVGDIPLDQS